MLQALLAKIDAWLKPQGLLFVHMFTHKLYAYHFEVGSTPQIFRLIDFLDFFNSCQLQSNNEDDWMAKYFFSGGTMASANLLHYFQVRT